ncbi:MAG: hypothetical protein J3K34DRAFT_407926, partial [Monoraphidium minutum]
MEHTRLADLSLAVANRPTYLYCHQGCCEHGWFVTDIRLRHPQDPEPHPPPAAAADGAVAGSSAAPPYPRTLYLAPPPASWR